MAGNLPETAHHAPGIAVVMADQGRVNLQACLALFNGLVAAGVSQAVISPGSRSTPLVLAADQHPGMATEVIVDERSAAFFALGMARQSGRPVVLICTSGSAPANWFPAVMEASASGVPLILISADRPAELQHCGANQTIDQKHLFGAHVRAFHQLESPLGLAAEIRRLEMLGRQLSAQAMGMDPGPVHVNFPFREPLLPDSWPPLPAAQPGMAATVTAEPATSQLQGVLERMDGQPGVLVAGPGGGHTALIELARRLQAPLLADPLADLRFGWHANDVLMSRYGRYLDQAELTPKWLLRFGAMPVSSALQRWLGRQRQASHWLVDARGRWADPLSLASSAFPVSSAVFCRRMLELADTCRPVADDWLGCWQALEAQADNDPAMPVQARWIRALIDMLAGDSLLFVGNSLSIRLLDDWCGQAAKRIQLAGNRGVSGIDGNLATALGHCQAWRGRGQAVAVLGDLSFQHDLHVLAGQAHLPMTVVVFNNQGGGIFETLAQSRLASFERYWKTPQDVDFSAVAQLYGVEYRRLQASRDLPGLADSLAGGRLRVLEVMLDG